MVHPSSFHDYAELNRELDEIDDAIHSLGKPGGAKSDLEEVRSRLDMLSKRVQSLAEKSR